MMEMHGALRGKIRAGLLASPISLCLIGVPGARPIPAATAEQSAIRLITPPDKAWVIEGEFFLAGTCIVGCHAPKTYDRKKTAAQSGRPVTGDADVGQKDRFRMGKS